MIRTIIFVSLFTSFASSYACASSIYTKNGNIFYKDNGKIRQLTFSRCDEQPAVYPKGEWVYFVRSCGGKWIRGKFYPPKPETLKDGVLENELWRVRIDGSGATLLYRNNKSGIDGPDYVLALISNIQFSPDGDKVYFETPEWVTSAALHVMKPDGSDEKMLGPGTGTKIILSASEFDPKYGSCRGYIVTSRHQYWLFGGSYDWWYLFTPDFKEVAPLGEDFDYFTERRDIVYTDHSEKHIKKSKKIQKFRQ